MEANSFLFRVDPLSYGCFSAILYKGRGLGAVGSFYDFLFAYLHKNTRVSSLQNFEYLTTLLFSYTIKVDFDV